MSKVEIYLGSAFADSIFFHNLNNSFHLEVKTQMQKLAKQGTWGAVTARVISPLVGASTLLISLVLRVCSIAEPIIGILVDLGAALVFRSSVPLFMALRRFFHIFKNLAYNTGYIFVDLVKIGVVATLGGIIAPVPAYAVLSERNKNFN